ncbi:MAG: MarR family transcriptional regulator [candidate division Zixibacteria bacterium]|nr:MarR family transcriptional regulator [candidate division Zixibacteria bacterium]
MDDKIAKDLDKLLCFLWAKRQTMLRYYLKDKSDYSSPVHTPEQFSIITILDAYGHGVPVKDIASQIDIPHSNVSRTLDGLEKRGLIRRTKGKTDRREVSIHLTLQGKKAARFVGDVSSRLLKAMWGDLPENETTQLYETLLKVI